MQKENLGPVNLFQYTCNQPASHSYNLKPDIRFCIFTWLFADVFIILCLEGFFFLHISPQIKKILVDFNLNSK